jgi:hypothetical protein
MAGWLRAIAVLALSVALFGSRSTRAQEDGAIQSIELRLPGVAGSTEEEVVWVGWPRGATGPLPVLVALHGAGEARRGRGRGHLGWPRDYALGNAFEALLRGRLRSSDYGEMVDAAHLRRRNRALRSRAFAGLVVVAPYTPNLLPEPVGAPSIAAYGDWIAGPLLAAVRARVSCASSVAGIDGVSLGGRMSLEVGLTHRETFASVGAIQPAVRGHVPEIAALLDAAHAPALRLLSSEADPFLTATRQLSAAWTATPHELLVLPGPHDYAFNRGPGAIELLFFHERALASLAAPRAP